MNDSVDDLNDREKAAALEDLVSAFRDEWVDLEQSDARVIIDGTGLVSPETMRVLRLLFGATPGTE